MEEVKPFISPKCLVLFDVDETLITNSTSLGTAAWRSWVKSKLPKTTLDFALYDALTLHIAKNIPYKPVEPIIPVLIQELQQSNTPVFAFTARGRSEWYTTNVPGVDQFTYDQLSQAGIDFSQAEIPQELQDLDKNYFFKGIIFAKHISKGQFLKQLFHEKQGIRCLIFVDDRLEQVQSVESAMKEINIPCTAFWYRRCEEDGKSFNPSVTNVQLDYLLSQNRAIGDEEAAELIPSLSSDPHQGLLDILNKNDLSQISPHLPLLKN